MFITITPYAPASWEIESPFGLVYPCTTREKSDGCPVAMGGQGNVLTVALAGRERRPPRLATIPSRYRVPHASCR